MPPTPSVRGRARPADAVNDLIRAVARRAQGRDWTQAEQALYRALCEEWVEAKQAKMVKAA